MASIQKTLPLGGFSWLVEFDNKGATIHRPSDFPNIIDETTYLPLALPPYYSFFSFSALLRRRAIERMGTDAVEGFISRELLRPYQQAEAQQRKKRSRSKAPNRRRGHKHLR